MPSRLIFTLLMATCCASPGWTQIPPAPPGAAISHDGYNLTPAYERWSSWIESQKGAVSERALARPEVFESGWSGRPFMTAAFHNDYGRFATSEIRARCAAPPAAECEFLYSRADVPLSRSYGPVPNALDVWMRENFDPALVVRNLREAGKDPGSDLWRVSAEVMFAGAASPQAFLTEHLRVLRLKSRDCPALLAALQTVETQRPVWALDLRGVGEDRPLVPPRPHAQRVFYTLDASVDGAQLNVSGGAVLEPILRPVLNAAYECERASVAP